MAYDDAALGRHRSGAADADPAAYRSGVSFGGDAPARRRELDDAPALVHHTYADPRGRDRVWVHLAWEAVLLLAVAALAWLFHRLEPDVLRGPVRDGLLLTATATGLLGLAAGLSLRAGVPNLAVGPVAVAAALHFAENGDRGLLPAGLPALGVAAAGGLVVAVLVLGLHVPAWAATLAAALGVVVFVQQRPGAVTAQGDLDPAGRAPVIFGAFALLAVLGGALGLLSPVRRTFARARPAGDPAARAGAGAAVPVVAALVLSSVFAAAAGMLTAAGPGRVVVPDPGLQWTGLAFGVALLGGTSVFGRRGGVFGTLLATAGVTLFVAYADRRDLDVAPFAVAAVAVAAGLVISRVVETYGRPVQRDDPDEAWEPAAALGGARDDDFSPGLSGSWKVPARDRGERWDDPHWDTGR